MEPDDDNDKFSAFDLIMTALKAHEKQIDYLLHEFDVVLEEFKTGYTGKKGVAKKEKGRDPLVILKRWNEFKETSRDAEMIAYEIEGNRFHVYSMASGRVFAYVEDLPDKVRVAEDEDGFTIDKDSVKDVDALRFLIDGRLKCGLGLSVKSSRTQLTEKEHLFELSYELSEVKEFLSKELSVSKRKVVEGKLTY